MNINMHRVKSVVLTEINQTSMGSFVRDIVITCDDGQKVEITLFTKGDDDALIPREISHEDWK